jgi:hypothetical protein
MVRTEHLRRGRSEAGLLFGALILFSLGCFSLVFASPLDGRDEPTIEELKGRVANASVADRPPLCIRIAERQLDTVDRLYIAGDSEKALAALTEMTAFAELARDYAVQSHKHEKQSEIAVRKMARKLGGLKHIVSREEQDEIEKSINRLEQIRDDLLAAMFRGGNK